MGTNCLIKLLTLKDNKVYLTYIRRSNGLDAIYPSTVVAMHELAHAVGAEHIDSEPNIMHSSAISYAVQGKLGLLEKSKAQMKACLKRNGFYKRKAK